MTGSADSADAEMGAPPLSARMIAWHWKWPVLIASAVFLVLLSAVLGVHSMSGGRLIPEGEQGILGMGNRVRTDVVVCFVAAYTLGADLIGLGAATRAFDRLRPILRLADPERRAFRGRLFLDARALFILASIGGAVGVIVDMLPYVLNVRSRLGVNFRGLPFMFLLFALLGMQALTTIRQSQVFRDVGRRHIEVDPLDLASLSPFSSLGLTNASFWFIGSALASFLVTSDANVWIVGIVITATLGLGIVGLILPSRGLHQYIRECKRKEPATGPLVFS